MQVRRTLIIAFLVLSVVALLDIVQTGAGTFGSIFDQTLGQIDMKQSRGAPVAPTFESPRDLEPIDEAEWIVIERMQGDLHIMQADSSQVTAEYTVRIWGSGDAEAFADEALVKWEREAAGVRLILVRPESLPAGIQQLRVDVSLAVPGGVDVSVSHSGDVVVDGLEGKLSLNHAGGAAQVKNVRGPVTVSSRFSSLALSGITGPVTIDHMGGDTSLREIEGAVTGGMQFGEIDVASVAGDVEMSVSQGAGTFEHIRGDLRVTGGFGRIHAEDVDGYVKLDSRMAGTSVAGLKQGADLSAQFGDLSVTLAEETGWNVNAIAEMGEIHTDLDLMRRQEGPRTELTGVIGDGSNDLNIDVRQGSARLFSSD